MILCEDDVFDTLKEIEAKVNEDLKDAVLELVFVNSQQMQELNKAQRGFDKITDVLSFPLEQVGVCPHLGSVVINSELAATTAVELGHSLKNELCLLFIHALLHLRGFDHEVDDGLMREKEKDLVKYFLLPDSLIIRNS